MVYLSSQFSVCLSLSVSLSVSLCLCLSLCFSSISQSHKFSIFAHVSILQVSRGAGYGAVSLQRSCCSCSRLLSIFALCCRQSHWYSICLDPAVLSSSIVPLLSANLLAKAICKMDTTLALSDLPRRCVCAHSNALLTRKIRVPAGSCVTMSPSSRHGSARCLRQRDICSSTSSLALNMQLKTSLPNGLLTY